MPITNIESENNKYASNDKYDKSHNINKIIIVNVIKDILYNSEKVTENQY